MASGDGGLSTGAAGASAEGGLMPGFGGAPWVAGTGGSAVKAIPVLSAEWVNRWHLR